MQNEGLLFNQSAILLVILFAIAAVIAAFFYFSRKKFSGFSSATPMLDQFSRDLTALARRGELDPIIGRKHEIEQLTRILSRRTKNNVVLVGEAGVGKTAIMEGLAQNIAEKLAPADLYNKRILSLDLNALIAGTKYRGEFEERIKRITEEISRSRRTIILFIDEIHNLIEPESSGESISAGDILKPAMARGELQVAGATTPQEYETYFKNDPAFRRRLQPIFVSEPDGKETLKILQGIKEKYETYHGVKITDEALVVCVQEGKEIMSDRSFPDKAIDLMDETASKVKLDQISANLKISGRIPRVKAEDVRSIISEYEQKNKHR